MLHALDDIVWTINPAHDGLADMTARMRAFAAELLETRGIALAFEVEPSVAALHLPMEHHREFFLLFKETVDNLAKYAHCRKDRIVLSYSNNNILIIKVLCDNNRILDAIYAEANDYLLKKTPPVRLLKAIAEVQAGGAPLMPAVVRQVLRLFPRPGAPARVPAGAHWAWWFLLGVLACSFVGPACTLN